MEAMNKSTIFRPFLHIYTKKKAERDSIQEWEYIFITWLSFKNYFVPIPHLWWISRALTLTHTHSPFFFCLTFFAQPIFLLAQPFNFILVRIMCAYTIRYTVIWTDGNLSKHCFRNIKKKERISIVEVEERQLQWTRSKTLTAHRIAWAGGNRDKKTHGE